MKQTILSTTQSEILENLIVKFGQIVTSGQIYDEAGKILDYQQSKNLISKLVKNGWFFRIKRELYAITDLSSRGTLNLSPFIVANLLESESYVSFESALQQHGMFDQLTDKTVSISLHQQKSVSLSGMKYSFIKTKSEYFFGWQEEQIGNYQAKIATPEKALIDMVNFHKSEYAIDLVIEKLAEHKDDLDWTRFNDYLAKFSITTQKIFGFVFDLLGINSDELHERVTAQRKTSWMFPGDNKFNAKWRLYYRDYFDKYRTT
jgi:predicted transcriptional regulator of viral defense system